MNIEDIENNQLENFLKRTRLSEPSPQLKERIINAAKRAWNQAPLELPWLIPIRYLAASAAAAVLIIALSNFISDRVLSRWEAVAANQQPTDVEALPEMPYGSFVSRLAFMDRRPFVPDASVLNKHVETLRNILDETRQEGFVKPLAPAGGRSRLIPNPSSVNSYS
jgi:hypothetical protein